jgi:hypothetical protein
MVKRSAKERVWHTDRFRYSARKVRRPNQVGQSDGPPSIARSYMLLWSGPSPDPGRSSREQGYRDDSNCGTARRFAPQIHACDK